MSLFLIVTGDFVKTGGQDRANHALAAYLAEEGHEVHLVAFRADDDLLKNSNVFFHRAPKIAGSYFLSNPMLWTLGKQWAKRVSSRGGRVIVNGGNCDWGDVNWIHYIHAADVPQPSGGLPCRVKSQISHRLDRWCEKRIVPKARLVIANSEHTKSDLVGRLNIPAERIRTIYYGIDPGLFSGAPPEERRDARASLGLPPDRPIVALIGGMSNSRKGFPTAFAAWKLLCADPGWDVDLAAAGQGSLLTHWKAEAARAGLHKRIHFLGFTNRIPSLLKACDAHVLPSQYETYSLATQEALCAGLPAFITASIGIAERYPENLQSLLIPDPRDARDLARRLRDWRKNISACRELVAPFAERLRAYTWRHMASDITRLVSESPGANLPKGSARFS